MRGIREAPADLVILDISSAIKAIQTEWSRTTGWKAQPKTLHLPDRSPGASAACVNHEVVFLCDEALPEVAAPDAGAADFRPFFGRQQERANRKENARPLLSSRKWVHIGIAFDDLLCVGTGNRRVEVHATDTGKSPYHIGTHLGEVPIFLYTRTCI